jgi:hypothetical protein
VLTRAGFFGLLELDDLPPRARHSVWRGGSSHAG